MAGIQVRKQSSRPLRILSGIGVSQVGQRVGLDIVGVERVPGGGQPRNLYRTFFDAANPCLITNGAVLVQGGEGGTTESVSDSS